LLGTTPIPQQGVACATLQTLHRWSGYAPWRALNTRALYRRGKRLSPYGWRSVRRTRSCPVRGDRKGRRWRRFSEVWVPSPNKRFAGVYILLPCLPRLFSVESGFPPRKGLLIFCFVVPKWCLTLQNHAVTGCAGLFAGFEKTPISCGFTGCYYGTTCRLMMPNLAILAIKNYKRKISEAIKKGEKHIDVIEKTFLQNRG